MRKIQRNDVMDILQYEEAREDFRAWIIELKKRRRISVGPFLSFVFENRDTMLFQIQEMVRAERMVQDDRIVAEIEVYNSLVPDRNELSATMFVEITDQQSIKPVLHRFMGIDQGRTVWLEFGDQRVYGDFELGHSKEDKISAVHFVQFPFSPHQTQRFLRREDHLLLVVDHLDYREKAAVSETVRQTLCKDLES